MTDEERQQIDQLGYVVLAGFMGADLLAAARARVVEIFESEGEKAGSELRREPLARRLANLVVSHAGLRHDPLNDELSATGSGRSRFMK